MPEGSKYRRACGTREGSRTWINLDICGLICSSLTQGLLLYGSVATTKYVIIPWMNNSIYAYLHIFFFNFSVIIAMYTHLKTMLTDPGAVPSKALPLFDDQAEIDHEANMKIMPGLDRFHKTCRRCHDSFKPVRAHHCSICGRCVIKMDHHCPWVNNCVGIGNHKLFINFLFWVNLVCLYSLILQAGRVASCVWGIGGKDDSCFIFGVNMGILMLFMESFLFCMFTSCMMADQMAGAMTNQTQIDRLKNEKHEASTEFNEVFGVPADSKFQLSWLLPIRVSFPPQLKDKLLGYRLGPDEDDDDDEGKPSEKESLMTTTSTDITSTDSKSPSSVDSAVDLENGRYETGSNGSIRKRGNGPP